MNIGCGREMCDMFMPKLELKRVEYELSGSRFLPILFLKHYKTCTLFSLFLQKTRDQCTNYRSEHKMMPTLNHVGFHVNSRFQ